MPRFTLLQPTLVLACVALASCSNDATDPGTPGMEAAVAATAAASNSWITRANLPGIERTRLTLAAVPNGPGKTVLYAIGGQSAEGGSLGKVQAYDVATNKWTNKASLPVAAWFTNGAGVIGGKIYVSGGVTRDKFFRRELQVYDPATNTWTLKRAMPDDTWGGVTSVFQDKLYVLTCELEEDCYLDTVGLSLFRYDPVTDQWTRLGSSPASRGRPSAGFLGNKLYVTGIGGTPAAGVVPIFNAYEPATNQWTARTPLPLPRQSAAGVALAGKLYVIGGFEVGAGGVLTNVRKVHSYDPATDQWTARAQILSERTDFAGSRVVRDGEPRIEVVGGLRPGNNIQYIP